MMGRTRTKPVYAALAGAVLGLVVLPVAFAGAANEPQANASASVKKQVKKLKQRVAQLEGQQAPDNLPPSGPAGGDLAGNYPNPQIGPNAVGSEELANNSVVVDKIANEAVGTLQLGNGSILDADIASDSVGSSELKGVHAVVGSGAGINNNEAGTAQVTCPAGEMVIGGGFAWTQQETNSMIDSAPSETDPNQTWVVTGIPTGGSSNTLFAWANCLGV